MRSISTLTTQVVRKNAVNSFVSYRLLAQQLYEIGMALTILDLRSLRGEQVMRVSL
jgi:hypothetical protein